MYKVTKEKIKIENNEVIIYGIEGEGVYVNDVSADKDTVEQLVKLCNECQLSPCHISDVLEDFLAM